MSDSAEPNLGRWAYETYARERGGVDARGELPHWDGLAADDQSAWEKMATLVALRAIGSLEEAVPARGGGTS